MGSSRWETPPICCLTAGTGFVAKSAMSPHNSVSYFVVAASAVTPSLSTGWVSIQSSVLEAASARAMASGASCACNTHKSKNWSEAEWSSPEGAQRLSPLRRSHLVHAGEMARTCDTNRRGRYRIPAPRHLGDVYTNVRAPSADSASTRPPDVLWHRQAAYAAWSSPLPLGGTAACKLRGSEVTVVGWDIR